MGLDDAAGAVIEDSSWLETFREEMACLSVIVSARGRPMHSISHGIGSIEGSDRVSGSGLSLLGVSWANNFSKPGNSVLGHQLHAGADVALHVGAKISEERLSLVLLVEDVSLLWLAKPAHLQLRNGETVLIDGIDNLSSLSVTVWLHHGEGPPGSRLKLVLREYISIVYQLELSGEDSDDRA